MGRYRFEIDNVRAHVRSLWIVIALQSLIIAGLWIGWSQAPKQLTLHIPPDLRSGAVLKVNEVPPANVYAFAFYIFQQLNRWPDDGAHDYGKAIFRVAPYLTEPYRAELIAGLDTKAHQGELAARVRGVQEIPSSDHSGRPATSDNRKRRSSASRPPWISCSIRSRVANSAARSTGAVVIPLKLCSYSWPMSRIAGNNTS